MKTILGRLIRILSTPLGGALCVTALAVVTTAMLVAGKPFWRQAGDSIVHAAAPAPVATVDFAGVKLSAELSQGKFLQGAPGTAFLKLTVSVPDSAEKATVRSPVDIVVVLDRSGSMSDAAKLPFAKSAINDLLSRLNPEDRFSIIAFDDSISIVQYPVQATEQNKAIAVRNVSNLQPGGSTNISGGLEEALRVFEGGSGGSRKRKVLLLSDGEANVGVSDPDGLAMIARRFGPKEAVLSTIGMGLGFNERIMSTLADQGMGNFGYLEHLDKLASLLGRELDDARALLAQNSAIEIELGEGVSIQDAGGYPINRQGSRVSIPTGQLVHGSSRNIMLTLNVPTSTQRHVDLGSVKFKYSTASASQEISVPSALMQVAVVAPELRHEMLASVNKSLLDKDYANYAFNSMKMKLNEHLRRGDRDSAIKEIGAYQSQLAAAESAYGMPLGKLEQEEEVKTLRSQVDDAFAGSTADQSVKQNRLGKKSWSDALKAQREVK